MTAKMSPDVANLVVSLAGLSGAMAVAEGAFGAHVLKEASLKAVLQTAAIYQLTSACAALSLGLARRSRLASAMILVGGLIFGTSLDALVLFHQQLFGAVTPIGGISLIGGFLLVCLQARRPDAR
jgi:uncharacterized membrane protein YgdD (TMEM256/DUF423 family)